QDVLRVKPQPDSHRLGKLAVAGADLEDGKAESVQEAVSLLRAGHQRQVPGGELPERGVAEAPSLEKRADELQEVPGLVLRGFGNVRQVIAITAQLGKKPVTQGREKLPAEFEGNVIEGQWSFAARDQLNLEHKYFLKIT